MICVHFGIRSTLLVAFGSGLEATLIAHAIALFAFHPSYDSLVENTERSVPYIAGSVKLTQPGMGISAKVPCLAATPFVGYVRESYAGLLVAPKKLEHF